MGGSASAIRVKEESPDYTMDDLSSPSPSNSPSQPTSSPAPQSSPPIATPPPTSNLPHLRRGRKPKSSRVVHTRLGSSASLESLESLSTIADADASTTPGAETELMFKRMRTPSPAPVYAYDSEMEDYYRRSRRRGTRELSPPTIEGARAWNWRTLKEAVWVVKSYPPTPDGRNTETGAEAKGGRIAAERV